MKFGKIILNNFWLKIVALIFAAITWFYVINLIEDTTGKKTILAKMLPSYSRLTSKKLFIKAIFVGELPEKYKLLIEQVKIDPPYFIVAGPKFIINKVDRLETVPIDISKYRKTTVYQAQISSIGPNVDTEKLQVKVIIPIKKVETDSTSKTVY